MENPDDWDVTRSTFDYFGYASWILNDNFTNAELTSYFAQFDTWDLNFVLGCCALKDLNWARTGEQCYAFESERWERYDSLGLTLAGLGIDEPLTAAISGGLGDSEFPIMTDVEYAIRETADWLELVRSDSITANLPITLTEAYPRTAYPGTCKDDLLEFIVGLQDECDDREIEGISDLGLDFNWCGYSSSNYWNEVIEIEEFADSIGLDFAMIFWPARSYAPNDTDEDFLLDILYEGNLYFNTYGGSPDIIDVTAWDYVPVQQVPESYTGSKPVDDFPFTYSFLGFYDTYIDAKDGDINSQQTQRIPSITSISPNPSSSGVTIQFNSLNPSSSVHFEAFDIFGRLITDREISQAQAGNNIFTWDTCDNNGQEAPTGVYFVQLTIDGQVSSSSRLLLVNE